MDQRGGEAVLHQPRVEMTEENRVDFSRVDARFLDRFSGRLDDHFLKVLFEASELRVAAADDGDASAHAEFLVLRGAGRRRAAAVGLHLAYRGACAKMRAHLAGRRTHTRR